MRALGSRFHREHLPFRKLGSLSTPRKSRPLSHPPRFVPLRFAPAHQRNHIPTPTSETARFAPRFPLRCGHPPPSKKEKAVPLDHCGQKAAGRLAFLLQNKIYNRRAIDAPRNRFSHARILCRAASHKKNQRQQFVRSRRAHSHAAVRRLPRQLRGICAKSAYSTPGPSIRS